MNAEICCGVNCLSSIPIFQSVPMWRLTDRMVRSTLVTAWRLATSPTNTSPFLAKATTDGVVREPSALVMTVGSPPSRTQTTEFVVPRSMPTGRAMGIPPRKTFSLSLSLSRAPGEKARGRLSQVGSMMHGAVARSQKLAPTRLKFAAYTTPDLLQYPTEG